MARGNQREISREKNLKKLQAANKGGNRAGSKLQRDEEDKAKLEAKVAAKAAKKKEEEEEAKRNEGRVVVKPKKINKKKEASGFDDLLNAGLGGNKKKGKK